MSNDPIREAFDLLDRQPPAPSREFADALLQRLEGERATPAAPRILKRGRRPTLPPHVRNALIAAAALAVAAAVLLPLLPLVGNEPRPVSPPGKVIWIRQLGFDDFDVETEGVAVSGSVVYVASSWREHGAYYSTRGSIDAYDFNGRPLKRQSVSLDAPVGGIATDPNGDVYLLQRVFSGPIPIGSTLTKYSASGAELWSEDLPLQGVAWGLAADEAGVYVVGGTNGPLHNQDGFVASFDGDGTLRWRTGLETVLRYAGPIAVAADAVYLAGESRGKNGPATIWKLDRRGAVLWARSIDLGNLGFNAVAVTDGAVYVGGEDHGDALLAAFDPNGKRLWTRRWGTGGEDWVAGLAAAGSRVYVAGTTGVRLDKTGPLAYATASEGFLRAFDARGVELWSTTMSNSGLVWVGSLARGADGLYVGGVTDGAFPGHPTPPPVTTWGFLTKVGFGNESRSNGSFTGDGSSGEGK